MANHVWTRTYVRSDKKEVHNKMEEWYGDLDWHDDLIGSKWIVIEDSDYGENESYINFCSAWCAPIAFMEEFTSVILAMDENATIEFTGDEESDDFLFAGYGSINGFKWDEESDGPERPWEEECEEEGIDYDDAIDKFYDEVNETTSIMLDWCKKEVDKGE
jgi:hypothetical protein